MSLHTALIHQAEACEALGSPFTGRLLRLVAARLTRDIALAPRLMDWPGDLGPRVQSVPLRLAGILHRLVLSGRAPALAAAYPPDATPNDDALWQAVVDAMEAHAETLDRWLDSAPQTNEVRRAAVMIAAGHWLTARTGLPMKISELGASAGLNLNWDRFALAGPGWTLGPPDATVRLAPDWDGPQPPAAAPRVTDRRGVDLAPFDLASEDQRQRLIGYLWPDQAERLARTRAAIALPQAPVDAGDAIDWLEHRLAEPHPGHLHLVYHTIAWQYFPAEAQARGLDILRAAGARATPDAPLAHLGMEADSHGADPGAAITLTLWPGGETFALGRVDFHGRWMRWTPPTA